MTKILLKCVCVCGQTIAVMSSKLDKHIDTGQKAEMNEKFDRQSDKLVRMLYVIVQYSMYKRRWT